MKKKLAPLADYTARDYPKAGGTLAGKILIAASMAATSLGGCGPAVDAHTVDAAIDTGDLDGTTDVVTPQAADAGVDAAPPKK